MFKENSCAKVGNLKLLTKENLLWSFHYLSTYWLLKKIRSNQRAGRVNTLNHFHIKKLTKWRIKMTRYQRWRPKISGIMSLRRLEDISVIYVPLKRLWDMLSWSVSLRYLLARRYDVSSWSVLFVYKEDVTRYLK